MADAVVCGDGTDKATVDPLDATEACETVDRNQTPVVSAVDVAVAEGAPGTSRAAAVKVSLGATAPYPITVKFATVDGTANAGSDFEGITGTLTFAANETEKTVDVKVLGDDVVEGNEVLGFKLSEPSGAALKGEGVTLVGIFDDDAPATPPAAVTKVRPTITGKATTSRDRRAPYRFTVSGKLTGAAACAGEVVSLKAVLGGTTVATKQATVSAACAYRATFTVKKPKGKLPKAGRAVVVTLQTGGTATLLRAKAKKLNLRIG